MGQQLRVLATPAEVLSSEPSTHKGILQPLVTLAPVNLILSLAFAGTNRHMHVNIQTHTQTHIHAQTHTHKYTHRYTYIHKYAHTHVLTHMPPCPHTHTCTHTRTCRHNKIKIIDVNFKKNSGVYELFLGRDI